MKIAIATIGRFHLLNLAMELSDLGHEVYFYSLIPSSRCVRLGLPEKVTKRFFLIPAIVEYCCRNLGLPSGMVRTIRYINESLLDFLVARTLKPCDVMIGLSGVYIQSLRVARKKYGATILLERGSKHILEQDKILRKIKGAVLPSGHTVKREQIAYAIADYIVVGSEHVRQSFLNYGFSAEKLFVNPYGTSLSQFHPTEKPAAGAYDVIMVGGWSYRKGCDLLAKACLQILGVRLLHVGIVVDYPLPDHQLFVHVDYVEQAKLLDYYAQAKVFALPSREDGFGMVLSQALACGLPIVCSKDTGGSELARFLEDKKWIIEMPETTVECLAECIEKALSLAGSQPAGIRDYAGEVVQQLTWKAYGERYDQFLKRLKTHM